MLAFASRVSHLVVLAAVFARHRYAAVTVNPEFASSPANYAHWMLAHVYPTILAIQDARPGLLPTDSVHIYFLIRDRLAGSGWEDGNIGLLDWADRYRELLAPWEVSFVDDAAHLRGSDAQHLRVSVPHLSFCESSYFSRASALKAFIRTRPQFSRLNSAKEKPGGPRIFVLLRTGAENSSRKIDTIGLKEACEYWQGRPLNKTM